MPFRSPKSYKSPKYGKSSIYPQYGRKPSSKIKKNKTKRPTQKNKFPVQNETQAQLDIYRNPFSTKTQHPKIPDGSRNFSLGTSWRSSHSTTGPYICIALFPGFQSFGYSIPLIAAPANWPLNINARSHVFARPPTDVQLTVTPGAEGVPEKTNFNVGSLEAWRIVSAGMKIRSVNSDEQNNGHYQAIRLRHCHSSNSANVNVAGTVVGHAPLLNSVPAIATWPNDPSYTSGRLKDINMKDFMLATEDNEHPWTEWQNNEFALNTGQSYASLYDLSFDVVLVLINGSNHTNVLLDFFHNQETTHRAGTKENYYQTQTHQVAPATIAAVQSSKRYKCRKAAS